MIRNLKNRRSVRKRCPLCKKLRRKWINANAMHAGRILWQRLVPGGPKVCHICVQRSKDDT
jgi:hypothetical protein